MECKLYFDIGLSGHRTKILKVKSRTLLAISVGVTRLDPYLSQCIVIYNTLSTDSGQMIEIFDNEKEIPRFDAASL